MEKKKSTWIRRVTSSAPLLTLMTRPDPLQAIKHTCDTDPWMIAFYIIEIVITSPHASRHLCSKQPVGTALPCCSADNPLVAWTHCTASVPKTGAASSRAGDFGSALTGLSKLEAQHWSHNRPLVIV